MAKANSKGKKSQVPAAPARPQLESAEGDAATERYILTKEHSRIGLEACFQIEGLCDELFEQAGRIEADSADFQLFATLRAIADRIKSLNHVALQFLYIDPSDRTVEGDLDDLKSIVFPGVKCGAYVDDVPLASLTGA
jgi:hypothetical protein